MLQRLGFWRVLALGLVFPPGLFAAVVYDLADRLADGQGGFSEAATGVAVVGVAVVGVVFLGAVAWAVVVALLAGLL